jgi:RNA 2',3'-cyclic 3'-phosphodiesterase
MREASTRRLFVGIALGEATRDALRAYLAALGGALPGRAVPPANWHLTLRFLGATDAAREQCLVQELVGMTVPPPFVLRFGGLGAFPRAGRAKVLWMGIDQGADELRALAASVESAARAAGFAAEPKPFSPHLTLARVDPPGDLRALIDRAPPSGVRVRVEELVLFRSHLGGGGPRYEVLRRFPLP